MKIRVSPETLEALKIIAERQCMSLDLTVYSLIELYELRNMDILIQRIRDKYNQGLTPMQINHLSVLFTLMTYLDRRIGLH